MVTLKDYPEGLLERVPTESPEGLPEGFYCSIKEVPVQLRRRFLLCSFSDLTDVVFAGCM